MNRSLLALASAPFLLGFALGCGPMPEPGATASSSPGAQAADPAATARAFLQALEAGDEAAQHAHLTLAAREQAARGEFSMDGASLESWTVGDPAIAGTEASVPVTLVQRGEEQSATLLLRREESDWRLFGVTVALGDAELTVDFEGKEDTLAALGEGIAQGLAEGLAEGMQQAFDQSMAEWEAGGSAEEIARARAAFEAIEPLDADAFDAAWRIDLAGRRSAQAFVEELLAGTDLTLDAGQHADALARELELGLSGVSRVQALEHVAAACDLVPVLPAPNAFDEGPATLTFRAGPRAHPATFTGPFLVSVVDVEETAPHTRGALRVRLDALGLAPSALAMNRDMDEFLKVTSVRSAQDAELLADPDTSYMGAPTQRGGHLGYELELELVGLLRGVERLELVHGEVRLRLPAEVHGVRFDPLRPGERESGPWSVRCTQVGTSTTLELEREAAPAEGREVAVRFRADGEEGTPLGIRWESTSGWETSYQANLETPREPAGLSCKVVESEALAFAFELRGVALAHFAEQPERVTPLRFDGDAPLRLEVVGPAESSTPEFPQVRVAVHNGANKDALEGRATFEYLDARGEVIESFPHHLQGAFSFEGQEPLASAGAQGEIETAAFFRPDDTASTRVVLDEVRFVDGTVWTREP